MDFRNIGSFVLFRWLFGRKRHNETAHDAAAYSRRDDVVVDCDCHDYDSVKSGGWNAGGSSYSYDPRRSGAHDSWRSSGHDWSDSHDDCDAYGGYWQSDDYEGE